jgi:hypothetical protein
MRIVCLSVELAVVSKVFRLAALYGTKFIAFGLIAFPQPDFELRVCVRKVCERHPCLRIRLCKSSMATELRLNLWSSAYMLVSPFIKVFE